MSGLTVSAFVVSRTFGFLPERSGKKFEINVRDKGVSALVFATRIVLSVFVALRCEYAKKRPPGNVLSKAGSYELAVSQLEET